MSEMHRIAVSAIAMTAGLLAGAAPAFAQDEVQDEGVQLAQAEETIVVTGSRIRQDGFNAPTPTTVIGAAQIQAQVPKVIDDFLNNIPAMAGSMTLGTRSIHASNGTTGISMPNLRGLGTNRVLVLLDGQRVNAVTQTGETDVNMFPTQLIERVDVVTGGASAVYGSDALGGIVNFVLDSDFSGLKLEASGGVTTYGDDWNYKFAGAYGMDLFDERLHLLVAAEHQWNEGVGKCLKCVQAGIPPERDWLYGAPILVDNPAYAVGNGQPRYIAGGRSSAASATPGGIIVGGPLGGTAFTNDGQPYQFQYGTVSTDGNYMFGGDWRNADIMNLPGFDPYLRRTNFFGRADVDVTDDVRVYFQYLFSKGETYGNHSTRAFQGNLTLRNDNAFLPQTVRNAMLANNLATVRFGTFSPAEPLGGYADRRINRFSGGVVGSFEAFGDTYDWNFYAQRGRARTIEQIPGSHVINNLALALDAVFNASGQIVCRVNADTNPANDDPACKPINLIGFDPDMDPAVRNYVFSRPTRWQTFTTDVVAFDISGEPFDLWAGPVAFAIGAEHRNEKTRGTVDPLSQQWFAAGRPTSGPNAGRSTNFIPIDGEYDITEAFIETQIPLLSDVSFAQSLDFNGAVRVADYSTSGTAVTWKAGLTWDVIDGLRLRATRSRDIRSPNMAELFTRGLFITFAVQDPWNGRQTNTGAIQFQTGNPDLNPEKADTLGVGAVFEPTFIPGLRASVDYWKIDIADAISTVNTQTIVDECFAGNTVFCSSVQRQQAVVNGIDAIWVTQVTVQPLNFASEVHEGIDFEVSYTRPLFGGDISLRAFATRNLEAIQETGLAGAQPIDYLGDHNFTAAAIGQLPKWKYSAVATFNAESFTTSLTARGISAGKWSNTRVECTTACPALSSLPPGWLTVNDNSAPAAVFFDYSFTFRPEFDFNPELFIGVRNLFNKDPALQPRGPGGLSYGTPPSNPGLYDMLGRTFSAGLRIQM